MNPAPTVFVLAPPRCFTSVIATMIGQHPQLFGLPETNLFVGQTIGQWWRLYRGGRHPGSHGLVRALAELLFGGQSPQAVGCAWRWLLHRMHWPSEAVFEVLSDAAQPLGLVEKSPRATYAVGNLQRLAETRPDARFLHLTRHPHSQGASMLRLLTQTTSSPQRLHAWLSDGADLQVSWLRAQRNILRFEPDVPPQHWLRMRGEDAVADPAAAMKLICSWLGLPGTPAEIDQMLHPERSPFASTGPPRARFGLDPEFLADPTLRRETTPPAATLADPLPWDQGRRADPEVVATAQLLGYS